MEEWKDIKGYEGLYQVSNKGRVRSLDRQYVGRNQYGHTYIIVKKGKILKPCTQRGYEYVVLSVGGVNRKTMKVHRLVAEAFIPNPDNKPCIDHINTIRNDNRVENLRWVTIQENSDNPLTREHSFGHITHRKTVYQYTLDGELVSVYDSALEAANKNGWQQSCISCCCNGGFFHKKRNKWVERKTYKGYRWSYEPL